MKHYTNRLLLSIVLIITGILISHETNTSPSISRPLSWWQNTLRNIIGQHHLTTLHRNRHIIAAGTLGVATAAAIKNRSALQQWFTAQFNRIKNYFSYTVNVDFPGLSATVTPTKAPQITPLRSTFLLPASFSPLKVSIITNRVMNQLPFAKHNYPSLLQESFQHAAQESSQTPWFTQQNNRDIDNSTITFNTNTMLAKHTPAWLFKHMEQEQSSQSNPRIIFYYENACKDKAITTNIDHLNLLIALLIACHQDVNDLETKTNIDNNITALIQTLNEWYEKTALEKKQKELETQTNQPSIASSSTDRPQQPSHPQAPLSSPNTQQQSFKLKQTVQCTPKKLKLFKIFTENQLQQLSPEDQLSYFEQLAENTEAASTGDCRFGTCILLPKSITTSMPNLLQLSLKKQKTYVDCGQKSVENVFAINILVEGQTPITTIAADLLADCYLIPREEEELFSDQIRAVLDAKHLGNTYILSKDKNNSDTFLTEIRQQPVKLSDKEEPNQTEIITRSLSSIVETEMQRILAEGYGSCHFIINKQKKDGRTKQWIPSHWVAASFVLEEKADPVIFYMDPMNGPLSTDNTVYEEIAELYRTLATSYHQQQYQTQHNHD